MQENLINKLLEYIKENNPDVLFHLEQEAGLTAYLNHKVSSVSSLIESLNAAGQPQLVIEEICMDRMTEDLWPSKYNYICNLLNEEFEDEYDRLIQSGLLQYEVINLVNYCQSVFEDLKFSEATEDNLFTQYAIAGMIYQYMERNSEKENVSNGLQQSAKTPG